MPENKNDLPIIWEKLRVISTFIATILIPLVIAFVSQSYTKTLKDNEIGVKYVELAVGILREPPEKTPKHLRQWAVEIVNNHSTVPMSVQAIRELETEDLSDVLKDMHPGSINAIKNIRG